MASGVHRQAQVTSSRNTMVLPLGGSGGHGVIGRKLPKPVDLRRAPIMASPRHPATPVARPAIVVCSAEPGVREGEITRSWEGDGATSALADGVPISQSRVTTVTTEDVSKRELAGQFLCAHEIFRPHAYPSSGHIPRPHRRVGCQSYSSNDRAGSPRV